VTADSRDTAAGISDEELRELAGEDLPDREVLSTLGDDPSELAVESLDDPAD
jgi:hypothetical protein